MGDSWFGETTSIKFLALQNWRGGILHASCSWGKPPSRGTGPKRRFGYTLPYSRVGEFFLKKGGFTLNAVCKRASKSLTHCEVATKTMQ